MDCVCLIYGKEGGTLQKGKMDRLQIEKYKYEFIPQGISASRPWWTEGIHQGTKNSDIKFLMLNQ